MLDDELQTKKQELAAMTQQLNQVMGRGLMMRLQDPAWYLTGVKVGLESLRAFYLISELVYREHTANSEGGRRLANMRNVYDRLAQFAQPNQNLQQRTRIMLEIFQPLQLLLHEWEGQDDAAGLAPGGAASRRRTIVGQLAADIHLNLVRLRAFQKMEESLKDSIHIKYLFLREAKRKLVQQFHWQYIGYAKIFAFDDPEVL